MRKLQTQKRLIFVLLVIFLTVVCQFANAYFWKKGITLDNPDLFFGFVKLKYFSALTTILFFVLYILIGYVGKFLFNISSTFILAGFFSNLLDRIFYDGVVDYLSIGKLVTFNFADLLLIFGFGLLIYELVIKTPSQIRNV